MRAFLVSEADTARQNWIRKSLEFLWKILKNLIVDLCKKFIFKTAKKLPKVLLEIVVEILIEIMEDQESVKNLT